MPNLNYTIFNATSSIDQNLPTNIIPFAKSTTGWISEQYYFKAQHNKRFCLYPQELEIKFDSLAMITQLQILIHEFMIPTKIEVYVGVMKDDVIHYTKSGYALQTPYNPSFVKLQDNVNNGYKTTELKQLTLNKQCEFLKISIHKNYINPLNLYNQVPLKPFNNIRYIIYYIHDKR